MSYEKQEFKEGQVLTHKHLNHIEDGISMVAESQILAILDDNGILSFQLSIATGDDDATTYTFTINPTPSIATVTLSASGYTQSGNSITVANGTTVNWSVSASGYTGQTGTWTASGSNKTENITLTVSGGYTLTSIDSIEGITAAAGMNCSAISNGLQIKSLDGYDSYYFVTDKEIQVYTKDITAAYYALSIAENYTTSEEASGGYTNFYGDNSVRYRNSENNLPTEETPLTIPNNSIVCFTLSGSKMDNIYIKYN